MPRTYELPPFLDDAPVPVELLAALEAYQVAGSSVIVRCATRRYVPVLYNYYGTQVETVLDAPTAGQPVTLQLDFCTPAIIRLRMCPGDQVPEHTTPMVVGHFADPVPLSITEDAAAITLATDQVRLVLRREPFQLTLLDAAGQIIWQTRALDIDGLRRPDFQWNPSQQRWIFYHRYAYPPGSADYGSRRHSFFSVDLHYDEHIYGFGESFGRLDKRETQQPLWIQEGFSNASPATYKRVPFYMSTRGYGLFLNTAHAVRAHVGDREHTALSLIVDDTLLLDMYLVYGPTLAEILPRYHAITGAPAVPPLWTFGLWMARISYNRQAQVEAVAAELRARRIPCDVIHIDTDWYERDWECDLQFGASKFPDPAGMMARLREQGYRVCLWQWPNMVVRSAMFHEARAGGYLALQRNGQPYLFPGFEGHAGFIDYSNPAAVDWVKAKFRALFALGVAAIKVDFGEGAPPDAVYAGMEPAEAHSLYPLLYNRAIYEVSEETFGPGKAVIWARAAWAGSQRYPVHWSGDGLARFEDLACVLRSALSFGLSGFPFYSHDIGGFSGLPDAALYVRWAQLGLFSSHSRAHGTPPREPWEFGPEAESIFRRYAELRYRLLPYIYSEALACGRTGAPFLRPLVLDYQDDPNTYTLDDQYLFGRALLVAPILDETNRRRLYLPAGDWFDYWTKERLAGGGWRSITAPLDTLPLYVRAGALLPYAPLMQHTAAGPYDPLTVELYAPAGTVVYTVEPEDAPAIHLQAQREGPQLTVTVTGAPGQVVLVLYGERIQAAALAGQPLPVTDGQQVTVTAAGPALTITLHLV
ncbi:MAG: glycoside hydrolase family 31 protein [Anaerolineae bacterium]|nr:glycoside hydrolase family 31 protein [Anaerolineae bacterium]